MITYMYVHIPGPAASTFRPQDLLSRVHPPSHLRSFMAFLLGGFWTHLDEHQTGPCRQGIEVSALAG